jgi:hypothetical protein
MESVNEGKKREKISSRSAADARKKIPKRLFSATFCFSETKNKKICLRVKRKIFSFPCSVRARVTVFSSFGKRENYFSLSRLDFSFSARGKKPTESEWKILPEALRLALLIVFIILDGVSDWSQLDCSSVCRLVAQVNSRSEKVFSRGKKSS